MAASKRVAVICAGPMASICAVTLNGRPAARAARAISLETERGMRMTFTVMLPVSPARA